MIYGKCFQMIITIYKISLSDSEPSASSGHVDLQSRLNKNPSFSLLRSHYFSFSVSLSTLISSLFRFFYALFGDRVLFCFVIVPE